jgi:hypothetical protein
LYKGAKIGLVMRTFTRDAKDLDKQVKKVVAAVLKALDVDHEEEPLFDRIDIVIPVDKRYKQSDFGGTAAALKAALAEANVDGGEAFVTEVAEGDNNVGVLNEALRLQYADGVEFMIVNSPSAAGFLTPETVVAMCEASNYGGVLVVGVIIPESPHPTLVPKGLITNTLAGYDTFELVEIGGFDMMAAIAPIGEENPNAGVEEIPALLSLAGKYLEDDGDKFIAVIEPQGDFTPWQLPAEGTEDRANHDKSHATKLERMQAHANTMGMDLSVLERAVVSKIEKGF